MNKKIIEKYIKFAINNGYKKYGNLNVKMFKIGGCFLIDNMHGIFMQLKFIKAITNGLIKQKNDYEHLTIRWLDGYVQNYYFNNNEEKNIRGEQDLMNDITYFQALAIRDNKLEEFIINILNIGTDKKK